MSAITINPDFSVGVNYIGKEKTPALIIDNYCLNIEKLIQQALHGVYKVDKQSYYPGIRSPISQNTIISLIQPVIEGFHKVLNVPTRLLPAAHPSYFSLITKQPDELTAMQTLPHFDTARPYYFAVLLYLNEGNHGGTGFFRHRKSGLERIKENQVDSYFASVQQEVDNSGLSQNGYQIDSNEHYELIHSIPYKPNRMVIYPGNLLHSTLVDEEKDISDNPAQGRLTANIFLEFQ
ncbi:DUF6445 family protein [Thalassotalea euphylliae]|uniref:DUF6445 family protein n=1 Tax=Thalassotalea euphylliae TaxID=1655234 RepID=UPI0036260B52